MVIWERRSGIWQVVPEWVRGSGQAGRTSPRVDTRHLFSGVATREGGDFYYPRDIAALFANLDERSRDDAPSD